MKAWVLGFTALLLGLSLGQEALAEDTVRIHYGRPDGVYDGFELHVWEDTVEVVTWEDGLDITGEDSYGVYWDVRLKEGAERLGFIVHKGDEKDPGPDMFLDISKQGRELWLKSGDETLYTAPPLEPPTEGTARIHYHRPNADYDGFELHVWEDTVEAVSWEDGLDITGSSQYGVYWDIKLKDDAARLGFIIHKGDEKDPGPDMFLDLSSAGNEAWILSGRDTIFTEQPNTKVSSSGDLSKARAHWLSPQLIAWDIGEVAAETSFALHVSPAASLELEQSGLTGGDSIALNLSEDGLPQSILEKFPHLAGYSVLELPEDHLGRAAEYLQAQVAVSMSNSEQLLDATSLQIPGVLDALYADAATSEPLGISWNDDTPSFTLWAPTAQGVKLHLFDEPTDDEPAQTVDMNRDQASGIWQLEGDADWQGQYYLYEVLVYAPSTRQIERNLVTDPYSVSLSQNSTKSQIVDLDAAELKPEGWDALQKPPLESFNDITLYELHVRDFSVYDETVSEALRGTYLAFTQPESSGMKHLASLSEAGLSHLHLLPTFNIATIDEDKSSWKTPEVNLASLAADSPEQQAALNAIRDADPYNWGYDPYHYNVPEGSYTTDPQGSARILEYRQMVQSLNDLGLRVVNDVVYNHTNSAGQNDKSVLDKIVPGYYHRLNADGSVETSTCCQNTATEHAMMRKLMVDSVVLWATAYKVDAFRFDLMGHHMVDDMRAVRDALDALTLAENGVDGSKIYLYGEGWNFGEVANNARGVNATQFNMAGTGLGTFNDRLRDAVRGGGPFDSGQSLISNQGFINGLYYLPNEAVTLSETAQLRNLLVASDQIRVGLAGNLAAYEFETRDGQTRRGEEVDYNGSPTGYTELPQENIVYISKHDNQTLWDISQYKIPEEVSLADRMRMHNVGLSLVALSQGIPFFQAGSDLLRSKSFDRDSYNSGDWFNKLDFSYEANNFAVGLPPAATNRENWPLMAPRLVNPNLKPGKAEILSAAEHFRTMLEIRYSSPLFRLETAGDIQKRLKFHNTGPKQVPGVIVMSLTDSSESSEDIDPDHEAIVVVFNATAEQQTLELEALEGLKLQLHPLQQHSEDDVVKASIHNALDNTLSVPAFTTAIFVAAQP